MNFRLQGTDGIRGPVCHQFPNHHHPVEWFQRKGELTPAFFQLYAYTLGKLLLNFSLAQRKDRVVIGWDSRDPSGLFDRAAVHGLQITGLQPITVGILPTPAIAYHMLSTQACAALVLTASHNPADQNGIKIFLGFTGLKFLPVDDVQLTQLLLEQPWPLPIESVLSPLKDESQQARQGFLKFLEQAADWTWLRETASSIRILTDSAFGACQTILPEFQSSLSQLDHLHANSSQPINQNSGVADFEGHHWIDAEALRQAPWDQHAVPQTLWEAQLQSPEVLHLAWIFDGDGDRCFVIVADPLQHGLRILGGDALMLLLGEHLRRTNQTQQFINTVESDLEATQRAQQSGFCLQQCPVGDKWLLLEAFGSSLKALQQRSLEFDPTIQQALLKLQDDWQQMKEQGNPSALALTLAWRQLHSLAPKLELCRGTFTLAGEESGHTIIPARVGKRDFFLGNGPLTALFATQAIWDLWKQDRSSFYQRLATLQPHGFRSTSPVYYVDKTLLLNEVFRAELKICMEALAQERFANLEMFWVSLPEDPELLMLQLRQNQLLQVAIFVRNSGTEDKLSLYVQGSRGHQSQLEPIVEELYWLLLTRCKSIESSWHQAERSLLLDLAQDHEPRWPSQDAVQVRLFHELRNKQKLLSGTLEAPRLTALGQRYARFLQTPSEVQGR